MQVSMPSSTFMLVREFKPQTTPSLAIRLATFSFTLKQIITEPTLGLRTSRLRCIPIQTLRASLLSKQSTNPLAMELKMISSGENSHFRSWYFIYWRVVYSSNYYPNFLSTVRQTEQALGVKCSGAGLSKRFGALSESPEKRSVAFSDCLNVMVSDPTLCKKIPSRPLD
jgi:hypothetical protein